jgi:hypothetical protein
MDKTTFVFGAPAESEEGKFIKFFSRLSLSFLLSLFIFVIIIIVYLFILFLNQNTKANIKILQESAKTINSEIIKNDSMKETIDLIKEIDRKTKLANLLIDTHFNSYALLEFFEKYTLSNVYLKSLKFKSERVGVAPIIKNDFDLIKSKWQQLKKIIKNESLAPIMESIDTQMSKSSGFPQLALVKTLNSAVSDIQDVEKFPLESQEARNLAKEISEIGARISQKLSAGEAISIEGEAADFSDIARQIVTFKKAQGRSFMDPKEPTVQKVLVSTLNLTQDGTVSFKMDLILNPNYLLAK